MHIQCGAGLFSQNSAWYLRYPILTMIVNGASTERQQFLVLYIGKSRYCTDIWAHNRTIDRLCSPKYSSQKEHHWFQNDRYSNLQTIQKVIIGCWMSDFDQIILSNGKSKSTIRLCRRTRWTTHWQHTQLRGVGRFPSNCTPIDISGELMTQTANLAMVQFWPRPGPTVTVQNRCYRYSWQDYWLALSVKIQNIEGITRILNNRYRKMHTIPKVIT